MIDGGILLMLIGAIGMGVMPIDVALARRRWVRDIPDRAPLRKAFPIVKPDPALTALLDHTDD